MGLVAHARSAVLYLLINAGNINANGMLRIKKSIVSAFADTGAKIMPASGNLRNKKKMQGVAQLAQTPTIMFSCSDQNAIFAKAQNTQTIGVKKFWPRNRTGDNFGPEIVGGILAP